MQVASKAPVPWLPKPPYFALHCLLGVILIGAVFAENYAFAEEGLERLRLWERAVCDVYERAAPAVVVLDVELRRDLPEVEPAPAPESGSRRPLPPGVPEARSSPPNPDRSEGSGFIVREDGVILTNYHVVNKAQRITVRLKDGRRFPARILGADERLDVAAVQIEARGLPALKLGESDSVRVGQWVAAIGAPFSQEWSFTSGLISGKGRSRLLGPGSPVPLLEDYLQTDALISPGHSGGPLLDLEAQVIGMNTLITRVERGLAFAVPSNMLREALQQILAEGRVSHPWLGIRVETLADQPGLRERLSGAQSGAVVLSIEPSGPAFRTDLRPADVIQKLEGAPIRSALDLQRELFARKVGQPVQLSVWRPSGSKVVVVQTMEVPEKEAFRAMVEIPTATKMVANERFGLSLKEVKSRGVRVEVVEADSCAARAELVAGDLITDVEGHPVRSVSECLGAIRVALSKGAAGGAILQIERQGRRTFVVLKAL